MKKFRISVLLALVLSVFAFTSCNIWGEIKGLAKNKWTKVEVNSSAMDDQSSAGGRTYNLNVYFYYTDTVKREGNLQLGKGLNVLVEADAGNAQFFGESISTASYAIKTFAPNEEISSGTGSDKKTFKVTDDAWAAAYAIGAVKSSSAPESSKSSAYNDVQGLVSEEYWKQFMAEKIIEFLLG